MATPYEISLKSVLVIENGTIKDEKGNNALMISLFNPDIGKTCVVSTRHLELEDNVELDYSKEHYKKKILFKESILFDTYIEVELTSISKPAKLNQLLFKGLKAAISKVDKIIPNGTITGAVKKSSETLFDLIEPKDEIEIIGRQELRIPEDYDKDELHFNLQVPKKIELKKVSKNEDGNNLKTTKTLNEGFTNGHIILGIKKLN